MLDDVSNALDCLNWLWGDPKGLEGFGGAASSGRTIRHKCAVI